MKKLLITLILAVSCCCLSLGFTACSFPVIVDGVTYKLSDDRTSYAVTDFDSSYTEFEILSEYNGKPVTSIEDGFYGTVTKISIPDSITYISNDVFSYHCDSLEYNYYENGYYLGNDENPYVVLVKTTYSSDNPFYSFTVNENTNVIYYHALAGCNNLMFVTIPDGVTQIGAGAFRYCTSLLVINSKDGDENYISCLPESLTYLGTEAFYSCKSLISVKIPEGITGIASYAFWACTSLIEINIPESVTAIGIYAFVSCNISSITIPEKVTFIGQYAFSSCSSLTSATFEDTDNWWISNSVSNDKDKAVADITLSDEATNATYLTNDYREYHWRKS